MFHPVKETKQRDFLELKRRNIASNRYFAARQMRSKRKFRRAGIAQLLERFLAKEEARS